MPKRKGAKRSWENVHKEYDENGYWNQERNRVKGALRQAFRMSPQMWETLQASRVELPPALKKDGTPGKRPRVRYKCAMCGDLFMQKYVNVDHIEPVVPLDKTESKMTYDEIGRGIFCKKDNLQVLCKTPMSKNKGKPSCHKIKTDEENYIRKQINEKGRTAKEIPKLKKEFQDYLIEKEKKRIAKEKRKAEREAKRNSKK